MADDSDLSLDDLMGAGSGSAPAAKPADKDEAFVAESATHAPSAPAPAAKPAGKPTGGEPTLAATDENIVAQLRKDLEAAIESAQVLLDEPANTLRLFAAATQLEEYAKREVLTADERAKASEMALNLRIKAELVQLKKHLGVDVERNGELTSSLDLKQCERIMDKIDAGFDFEIETSFVQDKLESFVRAVNKRMLFLQANATREEPAAPKPEAKSPKASEPEVEIVLGDEDAIDDATDDEDDESAPPFESTNLSDIKSEPTPVPAPAGTAREPQRVQQIDIDQMQAEADAKALAKLRKEQRDLLRDRLQAGAVYGCLGIGVLGVLAAVVALVIAIVDPFGMSNDASDDASGTPDGSDTALSDSLEPPETLPVPLPDPPPVRVTPTPTAPALHCVAFSAAPRCAGEGTAASAETVSLCQSRASATGGGTTDGRPYWDCGDASPERGEDDELLLCVPECCYCFYR